MPECPDFEYIRTKVPIATVARDLGLRVCGSKAHCWRTESHRNGDADPSIRFLRRKNKGRCFICDSRTWSNIDLVMLVRDCDLLSAARWIAARYSVPSLPKGSHIKKRESWTPRFHAGDIDSVMETLVRSGLWRDLTNAQRSLLPALVTFCDRKTRIAKISYQGLMRYSGVGSPATISSAMKRFVQMGFLEVTGAPAEGPTRQVNHYTLNFEDAAFQSLVAKVFAQQREEIEVETKMRAESRSVRKSKKLIYTG